MTDTDDIERVERYDERTYYQSVCVHPDHDESGFEAQTPRLKRSVAELDAKCHPHPIEDIRIVSYEAVGGIVPKPDSRSDIVDLIEDEVLTDE